MTPLLSIRLEALRCLAVLMVLFWHHSYLGYTGPWQFIYGDYGHAGVIVFFVLSGYVISYVAETRHCTMRHYMVARLGRLYSVLLPALFLAPLLDTVGRQFAPNVYATIADDHPFIRVGANLLFLQETSNHFVKYFSDGPMWSLAYEFWYYLLFGVAYYLRGTIRIASLIFLLLVTGYKILLLMPVWLAGVAIYHTHQRKIVPYHNASLAMFLLSIAFFGALLGDNSLTHSVEWLNNRIMSLMSMSQAQLSHSRRFVSDYLSALPTALVIYSIAYLKPLSFELNQNHLIHRAIKHLAGSSYSIYLFHVPLILCLVSTGLFATSRIWASTILLAAVVLITLSLARVSEHKVHAYRHLFNRVLP